MKKFLSLAIIAFSTTLSAQNVGIGTASPAEKLHIDSGNIKIGSQIWTPTSNHLLKFGDGEYVHVGEAGDDSLELQARNVSIRTIFGTPGNLDLYGSLHMIGGGLTIKDGTEGAGKVLSSNAAGEASWAYPPGYNTGFKAGKSSSQSLPGLTVNTVNFDLESYDDANSFSGTQYTVPSAGLYHFDAIIEFGLSSSINRFDCFVSINVNGTIAALSGQIIDAGISGTSCYVSVGMDHKLNAGDQVSVVASHNGSPLINQLVRFQGSNFSGRKIY